MGTNAEWNSIFIVSIMQQSKRAFGQLMEQQARDYLVAQGLKEVASNYQCKAGEIDLIMQDSEFLIFVEVRFRERSKYASSVESITRNKQLKIIRAAKYYLLENNLYDKVPCRFDVVAIMPKKIDWIRDAFWVKY